MLRQYGRDVLRELRNAEKTVRKIARWENNRILNICCIRYKYTRISAILKTNIKGKGTEQIIMKAENNYLVYGFVTAISLSKSLVKPWILDTHKPKLAFILDTKDLAEVTRLLASALQHTTGVTIFFISVNNVCRLCDKYNKVKKD